VWALAAAYFFVYFARQGLRSWLHFFLVDARGVDAATAAYRVSGMEVGGIVGTFAAGYLSDALDGRRVAVTLAFLAGLAASIAAAAALPAGCGAAADVALIALIGLFINGPQCLIGLIGAEQCDARVVGTVSGVLGWVSYGGATASGLPLSLLVRRFGWRAYWAAMILATVSAGLLLLPMAGLRARAPAAAPAKSRAAGAPGAGGRGTDAQPRVQP
jgi:MFS transporter, OPA family, sugar phosphate sensor protein UhpC